MVADITTNVQVVAGVEGLLRQRQRQVGVNAPLVEFVENNDVEVTEQGIGLQPRGQDALGGDEESRPGREAPLEPDLPADLLADGPPTLEGDAARQGAGRDAPRLQQDRAAEGGEGGRDARRLPRARRRHDHGRPRRTDVVDDRVDMRVDRERRLHRPAL